MKYFLVNHRCYLLESAINETLRVSRNGCVVRCAMEDTNLTFPDGKSLKLKKGDRVMMPTSLRYQESTTFQNPLMYAYDRFVDYETKPPSCALNGFSPFGLGKSVCPGRYFAIDLVKIIVAVLVHETEMELVANGNAAYDYSSVGVYSPKDVDQVQVKIKYTR